jgi:hypothetical protein
MSNRPVLNLVLLLVLGGLILLVWFEPGKETSPLPDNLSNLHAEDIQRLRIHRSDGDIAMQKHGARWRLTQPLSAAADQGRIDRLLDILSTSSHAQYPLAEVDAAQLGLSPAQYQLQLNDLLMEFGGTEALQQRRYVLINDTVHLITDRYQHYLQAKLVDFIDKQLLPADIEISGLRLPDLELRFVDQRWQIAGASSSASPDSLQMLLDEWRHARALRVSLDPLSDPAQNIFLELKNSGEVLHYLLHRSADEIIFTPQNGSINYHFPLDSGQRLLKLPSTSTRDNS